MRYSETTERPLFTGRHRVLMLVTEPGPKLVDIVRAAVDGGVDIVQWRDKSGDSPERQRLATALRDAAHPPTLLIVNGGVPTADGIHLPETGLSIAEALRIAGPASIVGRSIHSVDSATAAEADGADYLVAGTIFASQSHPNAPAAGLDFLRSVCTAVSLPVIAIGGITPANVAGCLAAGATGVAVLSPIMRSDNPTAVAAEYRAALDATGHTEL
jgi:thiamine-phosphate pyrophosphorylase